MMDEIKHLNNYVVNIGTLNSLQEDKCVSYFEDGKSSIDFILAYQPLSECDNEKRICFQEHLKSVGLELELDTSQRVHFVKIHAPKRVLLNYCEIMKMRMPIRIDKKDLQILMSLQSESKFNYTFIKKTKLIMQKICRLKTDGIELGDEQKYQLYHEYSDANKYLFNTDDPNFMTESTRITVVDFILKRQAFTDDITDHDHIGIQKLLSDGVYDFAYPLHNGSMEITQSCRYKLYTEWAEVRNIERNQPLDYIREYFGVQIAIYFAWLGFYTYMLIPASIFGVICFCYGIYAFHTDGVSKDICESNKTMIMCPQCDKCDYWYLSEACLYSRIHKLFENGLMIVFAIFISIWATLYLELWRKYSADIQHRWGMRGFKNQVEPPRPEYSAHLHRLNINKKRTHYDFSIPVEELQPPFWEIVFPSLLFSYSIIVLFTVLILTSVVGVIIFRMCILATHNLYGIRTHEKPSSEMQMEMTITAAIINLIVIKVLNFVYNKLAIWLNNLELKRTQNEYDEALSTKIYLLHFINYYSSIFYIALIKGKFVGTPNKYNRIFGLRQEECSHAGCLLDLFVQLGIIMIGGQAFNAVYEYLIEPFTSYFIRKVVIDKCGGNKLKIVSPLIVCNQWTEDYNLKTYTQNGLFDEYLEMIMQYGFVTIFAIAFPLAPLFALINNMLEIRWDARKFLFSYRRCVPVRVQSIGVWFYIMKAIGRISVLSSAFMIAFSTDIIPKLMYYILKNEKTVAGFVEHTLSYFETADLEIPVNNSAFGYVDVCRYKAYRNPKSPTNPEASYERSEFYWHILAARLAFVLVYQNIVMVIQFLVNLLVPDQPNHVRERINFENYIIGKLLLQRGKFKNIYQPDGEDDIARSSTSTGRYSYPSFNFL